MAVTPATVVMKAASTCNILWVRKGIAQYYSLHIYFIYFSFLGIAQRSPTYFWYVSSSAGNGDPFYEFLVQVAGTPNPPTTLSISYTSYEGLIPYSQLSLFNTEAMKLTAMGVTILAAAGDDGVSGSSCLCNSSNILYSYQYSGRGYWPQYPGTFNVGYTETALESIFYQLFLL